ncbi:MAG: hypothetical protein ABSE40_19360 [Candidatus Sulfotelmatobacter sp.]|jgi:hypothetical protein
MNRPICEVEGCGEPATMIVAWSRAKRIKLVCTLHAKDHVPKGYWVGRLEGYMAGTEDEEYDHEAWCAEKRAKALAAIAEGRPIAINQRRGF